MKKLLLFLFLLSPPILAGDYISHQWEWDAVIGTDGQGVATGYKIYYSMLSCCNLEEQNCNWSTSNMVDVPADLEHCGLLNCSAANRCCGDFSLEPLGNVLFFIVTAYNIEGESSTEHGLISSVPCP